MTTKKAVAKEVKKEVELTYQQKLEKQVKGIEDQIEQIKANLNQLIGAKAATQGMLDEYLKSK